MTLQEYATHLLPKAPDQAALLVRDTKIKCWLMGIPEDTMTLLRMLARHERYTDERAAQLLELMEK